MGGSLRFDLIDNRCDLGSIRRRGQVTANGCQAICKAVYLYWPAGERSAWKEVHLYSGAAMEMLRPGGYVEAVVGPGWQYFESSQDWQANDRTVVGLHLADLAMEAQAGRTHYVRVSPKPGSLALGIEMRPVEAEAALPEIQRCRRTMVVRPQ